jgi:hypothetical protein
MNCHTLPPILATPLLFAVQVPKQRDTIDFYL